MNARITTPLPALGAAIQGGFFHGILLLDGRIWGEVTAPKDGGEIEGAWLDTYTDLTGATSDFDGLGNTNAMADAGSSLAQQARALRIGGFDDWYIPARGGQLLQWGNLKPLLPEAEQFERRWYWSSTQCSRNHAFSQYFYDDKSWEGGRARAVRRFLIE